MKFNQLVPAAVFVAGSSAIAVPKAVVTVITPLEEGPFIQPVIRAPYEFITCTDAQFLGQCTNNFVDDGECLNLPLDWQNNISAVSSRNAGFAGAKSCTIFSESDCSGRSLELVREEIRDLKTAAFNDITKSFKCDEAPWSEPSSDAKA